MMQIATVMLLPLYKGIYSVWLSKRYRGSYLALLDKRLDLPDKTVKSGVSAVFNYFGKIRNLQKKITNIYLEKIWKLKFFVDFLFNATYIVS